MNSVESYPKFSEAFRFWVKLGFISFGGPAGQIAIMHAFLVEKKRWISNSRFLHALNYCMLLPGPEAQQLAIYTGWLLHGVRGGLAAGIFFVLPSMFILTGLSIAYVTFGHLHIIAAVFTGLKAAVIAIIFQALIKIGKKSLHGAPHYLMAFVSFLSIYFFDLPFPWIIIAAIAIGFILTDAEKLRNAGSTVQADNESGYLIHGMSGFKPESSYRFIMLRVIAIAICWTLPFLLLLFIMSDPGFWCTMIWFYTKAALVTFGGAYAVLPYVARVSVEQLHWLSSLEMLDGLALGETTPGPLIMVLSFVGFMAGYNHSGGSVLMGTLGLVVSTWYTFLPCFFFIFLGAPFIERTRNIKRFTSVLGFVTAAVTGAILSLGLYFARHVIFPHNDIMNPDWFSLLWTLISLFLLIRMKTGILSLIGISTVAGLLRYLLLR